MPVSNRNFRSHPKRGEMGRRAVVWVVALVLCFAAAAARKEDGGGKGEQRKDMFLLQESKQVVKTDAGEMRVVRSYGGRSVERPLHIGFITMEPRGLFIPQYLDCSLVLFIRAGNAKIGLLYKDELVEKELRIGDVYRIPAGSAFYLVNTGEQQMLRIVCSIDPSESLGMSGSFQSFFIGGGINPTSVLVGFEPETLSAAFNVSIDVLKELLNRVEGGPIISMDSQQPSMWSKFLQMRQQQERLKHQKNPAQFEQEEQQQPEPTWSWRKLLNSLLGNKNRENKKALKSTDSFNLYEEDPDFKNNYGWSIAVDEVKYSSLRQSGVGVYYVNLTAGSMMAPHLNPTATEYGIVLRGSGSIQVVYPNGTSGTNARLKEGDVFWVPKYFPFCQIASRTGPMEFFGFTTSSRENHPQFLVGANSLLRSMRGPEVAASYGMSKKRFDRIVNAQDGSVIVPSRYAAPPEKRRQPEEKEKFMKMKRAPKMAVI